MSFDDVVREAPAIITEGAVIERIRREQSAPLDPHILNAGLIYDESGEMQLKKIYKQYIDVGCKYNLPFMVLTPTWKAGRDRLLAAGFGDESDVNGDCVRFLASIRVEYDKYAEKILIGGLFGCKGDAYVPEETLGVEEAENYHSFQVAALSAAGIDFIIVSTLPAKPEAIGIAKAASKSNLPYIISFVVRADGALLDGTPLSTVISLIDLEVDPKPYCYMLNCVHPTVYEKVMESQGKEYSIVRERLLGLQANTSTMSPEELEGLEYLDAESPESLAEKIVKLHKSYGAKILGGCCGTNHHHIEQIARLVTDMHKVNR